MFTVCILHTGALLSDGYPVVFFSGGYIAVEFFFMVAGYYLAASLASRTSSADVRTLGTETLRFTFRRAKRLYPEFLCGFILILVLDQIIYRHAIISQLKKLLKSGLYELLLLHMANPHSGNELIFSVAWYISALIFATFILYPCLRTFPDLFKNFFAPLLMMFYLTMSGTGEDILVGNTTVYGMLMGGAIRAVAEMAWGTFLFDRVQAIRAKYQSCGQSNGSKAFWSLMEYGCFLFVIVVSFFCGNTKWDFTHFILLTVGTVICLSEIDFRIPIITDSVLRFCADYSFALYMTHRRVINFTKMLLPKSAYPVRLLCYLVLAIIFSLGVYMICKLYRKVVQQQKPQTKSSQTVG